MNRWWAEGEDEDEEMFISQLSGSEADRKSQSSVNATDSDDPMSDSEGETSTDDGLDQFGFPHPSQAGSSGDSGPLVLMENWDGQFVLVQPRQERSRSRRRGSRGSRTAGSIGASTALSQAGDGQGLIIDPDAVENGEMTDSDSDWSGMSYDSGDGGDTTDSMAEEDMPMLDSPALDQLIGEQMANVSMGVAVNGSSKFNPSAPSDSAPTPSIVVTDTTQQTLPLATPGLSVVSLPTPSIDVSMDPATPQPAATPKMGTFHPTTDHPAQHAVIDGSKNPTRSPFTRRRSAQSKRGRSDSFPSIRSRDERETDRKRKMSGDPRRPFAVPALPKKARYSSIPGHPRFIAARRAAQANSLATMSDLGDIEDEDTPSEEEQGMDLEDMLEESFISPSQDYSQDEVEGAFRFDRVPVSTYLRRHFGLTPSGAKRGGPVQINQIHNHAHSNGHHHGQRWGSSSMPNIDPHSNGAEALGFGYGFGQSGPEGLERTLAGPVARMMLLSPALAAVGENEVDESEVMSRREKRRRRRMAIGLDRGMGIGEDVPHLQL